MSATGLKIVDDAVQSTNEWVNAVNERTSWDHKHRSYRLLRSVLHAVRDHLSVDEAAQLAAQMPVLVRGIFYEGWNPSKTPVVEHSKDGFIAIVQKAFQTDPMGDAEQAIGAVMQVLDEKISAGEMDDVKNSFSKEIRTMFG